ncbi:MAG: hypothetical protein V1663_04815 [archaeon]
MVDILKELDNIEKDEDKLVYLEQHIKKIKDKELVKKIKELIKELKNKIVNKDLISEFTPLSTTRPAFRELDNLEVKYEPVPGRRFNDQENLREQNLREQRPEQGEERREDRRDEGIKYQLDKTVDYYRSEQIDSPFLRVTDELPRERDRDIRRFVGDKSIDKLLDGVKSGYVESDAIKSRNIKYLNIQEYRPTSEIGEDLKRKKRILDTGYIVKEDGFT